MSRAIFFIWYFILLAITGFLVAEYKFFKDQNNELVKLKDDYSTYILAIKKLIVEYSSSKEQNLEPEENSDQKKKINNENESQFLVVNRDFNYLKEAALAYARKHELELQLLQIYDGNEFVNDARVKQNTLRKKRAVKSNKSYISKKTYDIIAHLDKFKKLQREAVFCWPIDQPNFWLSSVFGPRKKPDGSIGYHKGIDLAAIRGTPVKAAGAGMVIEAGEVPGYGKTILIAHNRKFKTRYAHLSVISVKVGHHVEKLEEIGKVGATGNVRKSKRGVDGSHLHFEVYVFGKQQNPFYFLA